MVVMNGRVEIGNIVMGRGRPMVLIAGPCVLEDLETARTTAVYLQEVSKKLRLPFIFKASYDKANRTAVDAFRGPGIENGLEVLSRLKSDLGIPVLSDVHSPEEVHHAAQVLDVVQIPAFLCRQTDLLLAAAATQKPINVKKGQFLAPWDVPNIINKITSVGNHRILLTERGTMFGYNNLVVDFRGIQIMQQTGFPVVFDATHSVQLPGGAGESSGGQREFVPLLARAAMAAGADALFIEVHADPDKALCDGPNSLKLSQVEPLLKQLKAIKAASE